ncbi:MAG TPA: MMPL family transporter [Kribbella sp.]
MTSAAAVMIGVFAVFATLSTLGMKQLGVGLAVAILIDATIIRAVVLPSVMILLLGEANRWAPKWLRLKPAKHAGPAGGARAHPSGLTPASTTRRPARVDLGPQAGHPGGALQLAAKVAEALGWRAAGSQGVG